jgi:hypothetical protein
VPSWYLQDVDELVRQNPGVVLAPSRAERLAQEVGDEVRLRFHRAVPVPEQPSAERMWVRIESRQGDAYAEVSAEPAAPHRLLHPRHARGRLAAGLAEGWRQQGWIASPSPC